MASTFTYTWNGPAITEGLRRAADRGVLRAAHLFRNEYLRLILNTHKSGRVYGNHQASAPGQPPASDLGRLVQSCRVVHEPGSLVATVGVGTNYARMLELGTIHMSPRPAFLPAYTNVRPAMEAAITNEIAKEMA